MEWQGICCLRVKVTQLGFNPLTEYSEAMLEGRLEFVSPVLKFELEGSAM